MVKYKMWTTNSLCFLLTTSLGLFLADIVDAAKGGRHLQCGYPGRPANGSVTSPAQAYFPTEKARYQCHDGFVLFGTVERTCLDNGTWTGEVPICDFNLARGKVTQQSKTLWNYHADLATDGKVDSCSFTPREPEHRWWQVNLGKQYDIAAVAVTISPESRQEFSIFVIELVQGNKALYKECAEFRGVFKAPKALFRCNGGDGQRGQYVYIKDDRKSQAYFGLCEVEVFAFRDHVPCGDPEQPMHAVVSHNEFKSMYSCMPGFFPVGETSRDCQRDGTWSGIPPTCQELECSAPPAIVHGVVEVPGFLGRYRYGQEAQYRCHTGYTLAGNSSRYCNAEGKWSDSDPICMKIDCAPPPRFENAVYILEDGTTTGWNSVVTYHCLEGFVMNRERSNSSSVCTERGEWADVFVECIPGLLLAGPSNSEAVETTNPDTEFNNRRSSNLDTSASGVISSPNDRTAGPTPTTLEVILGLCAVATVVGIAILILAYLFVKKRKDSAYSNDKDFLHEFTSHCNCLERRENLYDEVYTPSSNSNRASHGDASLEPISIYDNGSWVNSSMANSGRSSVSVYDTPPLRGVGGLRGSASNYDIPHQNRRRAGSSHSNHRHHHRHSPRHSPRTSPRGSPKYENIHHLLNDHRRYENLILGRANSASPMITNPSPPSPPKHPVDATVITQRNLSANPSPIDDAPGPMIMPVYAQVDKTRKKQNQNGGELGSDSGRDTGSQPSSLLSNVNNNGGNMSPVIQRDRALDEEVLVRANSSAQMRDSLINGGYDSLRSVNEQQRNSISSISGSIQRSNVPMSMSTFGKGPSSLPNEVSNVPDPATFANNSGVVAEVKKLIYAQMDVSMSPLNAATSPGIPQDKTLYSNIRPQQLKGGNSSLRRKNMHPPPSIPKKPPHLQSNPVRKNSSAGDRENIVNV